MVNRNTQSPPRFAALTLHLCAYVDRCGGLMVPDGSFACGEAISCLLNALQAGEPLLPVQPRGSSDRVAHSWGSTLLPHWSTTSGWPLKLLTLCSVNKKLAILKLSPFSPTSGLGVCFSSVFPCACFHSFSLGAFKGSVFLGKLSVLLSLSLGLPALYQDSSITSVVQQFFLVFSSPICNM